MKNKQTLFGPQEKKNKKWRLNVFSMLTKCSNTKPTQVICFLTDAFKNNVLHKTIEATIMKIEQNLRNKQIYIVL